MINAVAFNKKGGVTMKKLFCLLIAVAVACGCLSIALAEDIQRAEPVKLTEEPITFRVFIPADTLVEDISTNKFTKWYEEKTNVHIEWDVVPAADTETRKNLILSSGEELPDIFYFAGLSTAQQVRFGSQGILLPLNDLIEEYAPLVKSMFEYNNMFEKAVTAPDGNIYALPAVIEVYHMQFRQKFYINQKWLDTLGLDTPQTTDEFAEVMRAFKTQDPNGNGLEDEIPISGCNTSLSLPDSFLMNAFVYDDTINRFILSDDGKVSVAYNQDGWREGLRYLAMLYSEELIDQAIFTQDSSQLKQLGNNEGVALIGCAGSNTKDNFVSNTTDRYDEYVPLSPLKGPEGVQYAGNHPYNISQGQFAITNTCEYPEIAMQWADFFYGELGSIMGTYGFENEGWRWPEEGEIGINGKPGFFKLLIPFGSVQNNHWNTTCLRFYKDELRNGMVASDDPRDSDRLLYAATRDYYEGYQPNQVLPPLYLSEDEIRTYSDMQININTYVNECMARFITGDMSVDDDWDYYLADLEMMGLDEYIEITQAAYDRQYVD